MPRYASQRTTWTLLLNPGDDQRALTVLDGDRADLQERAVRRARSQHGAACDLGWLDHQTRSIIPA